MKRKKPLPVIYLLFLFLLIFSNAAFSQDDIIMRNDDVIKAKVEEVGVNLIKYRKADNMDGPLYDMPKSDVYMIVYSNGSRDVINPRSGEQTQQDNVVVEAPIRQAPPEIPVYEQPACPVEGYLWTPGYWAFGPGGYYWVPGVWVMPPHVGYLWTPCYWGFEGGIYGFHSGYWGEHVGFYGGVDYGYGYGGRGYEGGRWEGGYFSYNTAVSRVDVTVVHTTYIDRTVIVENHERSRVSYNGGGGVRAEPTSSERVAMHENHVNPTPEQNNHFSAARSDRSQYVSENHGRPAVAAVNKPGGQHFTPDGHITKPMNGGQSGPVEHNNNQPHNMEPAHNNPAQHNDMGNQHNNGGNQERNAGNMQQHNNEPAMQHNNNPQIHNGNMNNEHNGTPVQQHTGEPVNQHNNAPVQHNAEPMQHNNAPSQMQHNSVPVQQHSPPVQHSAPPKVTAKPEPKKH